jgi:hypothetical protein
MALYKVTSAKEGNEAEAIVVDGNYSEGGRRAAVGGTIELSDAEHEALSQQFNLRKTDSDGNEEPDTATDTAPADDVPSASIEEGAGSDAGGSGATGVSAPADAATGTARR